MFLDVLVITGSICWLGFVGPSKTASKHSIMVGVLSILGVLQALQHQESSVLRNAASLVSVAVLAVATMTANASDNLVALLHLIRCARCAVSLLDLNTGVIRLVDILIHTASAWIMFAPQLKKNILTHIRGIFYVNGFTTLTKLKNEDIDKNDFYSSEERQQYNELKKKFNWNPRESFGFLKATARMAWFPWVTTWACRVMLNIASHMRSLLLLQICGTFAISGYESQASFWKLFTVWILSYIVELAIGYAGSFQSKLINVITSIQKEKLLEHCMKYNNSTIGTFSTTEAVVHKIGEYTSTIYFIFTKLSTMCMQIVNICIIASRVGWISVIPIAASFLLTIVMAYITSYLVKIRQLHRDSIKLDVSNNAQSFLSNMHVIKFYAWESILLSKIRYSMDMYDSLIVKALDSITARLPCIVPIIIGALTVLAYSKRASQITYVDISVLLYEVNMLMENSSAYNYLTSSLSTIISFENYVKECAKMLAINYISKLPISDNSENAVEFNNCVFSWGKDKFTLQPLTLDIKHGSFVTIVGKVGCGKSSLLSGISGEMPLDGGQACVYGSIGYVSQKPWIMNATIRENILFGNEYDIQRLTSVIQACALTSDLEQLPAGDMTEIGHNGINLSGGQKARLALARAIYNNANVYILDDILAAVDAHVERHLVEHVLAETGILKGKTRVLVTHANHVVPLSNLTITIDNGYIRTEIRKPIKFKPSAITTKRQSLNEVDQIQNNAKPTTEFILSPELDVLHDYTIIWKFIKQSGYLVVALAIAIQFICAYIKYYQRNALHQLVADNRLYIDLSSVQRYLMLKVVVDLVANELSLQLENIRQRLWAKRTYMNLSKKLLSRLAYAQITTYERLSQSTINNIYYKIGLETNWLSSDICEKAYGIFRAICNSIAMFSISVNGLVVAIIPVYFVSKLNKWYELVEDKFITKVQGRLEIQANELMHELATGHVVARIHNKTDIFSSRMACLNADLAGVKLKCDAIYDINKSAVEFIKLLVNVSVLLFAKYASALLGYTIGPGVVDGWIHLSKDSYESIDSITNMHESFGMRLPYFSKYFAYADNIKQEAPHLIKGSCLQANWPEHGVVEFKNYSLKYRDGLDDVLHNLSFKTQKHEKVGIVGRTGAGKSSLTFALLRLVEAASGSIVIDEVDISTIGLYDLRSRISMVPQDPMLLEGTIRANLDPASEYSDAELWKAINKCQIEDMLNKPDAEGNTGLNTWVEENGRNFSVGQRQLFSLCRALLWKRTILILDEATANIDNKTDQLMQDIIRTEFKQCTVLTIAHRLDTVMDSDRIMVMDQGTIAEFDTPQNLLAQQCSQFSQLVKSMEFNEHNLASKMQ